MYTGADFTSPELVRGDGNRHSHALLGILDAIAPAFSAALVAADAGDWGEYERILAPTVELSRHIFAPPTYNYKAGIVFLAWLNGHQPHFKMLGGMEGARSVEHYGRLLVLAGKARLYIAEASAELGDFAAPRGVALGIEPMPPVYGADRSAVVTLRQALALAAPHPQAEVGVVIDAYHVWWDPDLRAEVAAARGRIQGYHVCDWLVPPPDHLNGRGMMGDGVIDLRGMRRMGDEAGLDGPLEPHLFNPPACAPPSPQAPPRVIPPYP